MGKDGVYSSGEFAKKAHVTKKTLRYYNDHGFLKPSFVSESGARFYTDRDFEKIQRILFLKYLGFSLEDIKSTEPEKDSLMTSLKQQHNLLTEKINQMNLVREILEKTMEEVKQSGEADWSLLLKRVSETGLKKSLLEQYVDTSNISVRIRLHRLYSRNTERWFEWIYGKCGIKSGMTILEAGCGSGEFWLENLERLPKRVKIILTDNSEGVLDELRTRPEFQDSRFSIRRMDIDDPDIKRNSADIIIANHVLFYASDIPKTLEGFKVGLKPGGKLVASTYGPKHMHEISDMMKRFDDRIMLAAKDLYEIFGKTNGEGILRGFFDSVKWEEYDDSLYVTDENDLAEYITSCHGNQNRYIVDNYKEFRNFIHNEVGKGFHVTKEAGIFISNF